MRIQFKADLSSVRLLACCSYFAATTRLLDVVASKQIEVGSSRPSKVALLHLDRFLRVFSLASPMQLPLWVVKPGET